MSSIFAIAFGAVKNKLVISYKYYKKQKLRIQKWKVIYEKIGYDYTDMQCGQLLCDSWRCPDDSRPHTDTSSPLVRGSPPPAVWTHLSSLHGSSALHRRKKGRAKNKKKETRSTFYNGHSVWKSVLTKGSDVINLTVFCSSSAVPKTMQVFQ